MEQENSHFAIGLDTMEYSSPVLFQRIFFFKFLNLLGKKK